MSVRVVAPCRLHFGLFHVPVDGLTHYPDGRPVRKFGGLGMMIDNPCVTVTATEADVETVTGTLAPRAKRFVEMVSGFVRETGASPRRLSILAEGPPEHVGLGVGTSLGMLIACVCLQPNGFFWVDIVQGEVIASWVQRGQRSAIGVHGFEQGGFIVDDGKLDDDTLSVMAERLDFPAEWRVVLVRPPTPPAWFGDRERTAFARTRPADRALALTDRLCLLAYDTVVPAVRAADFDTFAPSIQEFNRMAGEPFHDDQGGPYAGPEVMCVIDALIEMGAVGVGQSSWGPTVFAFCRDADAAERLAEQARERFSSATEVTVTAANNRGARIETV